MSEGKIILKTEEDFDNLIELGIRVDSPKHLLKSIKETGYETVSLQEEDGEKFCIDICFTFTSTTYTTVVTLSSDSFSFSSNGSGTFDPDNGASEICLDGDCTTVTVTNGGDRFSFKTTEPDTGCEVSVEIKKA